MDTEADMEQWLSLLSHDKIQQLIIVKDLLSHATSDDMSPEDRTVCKQAIRRLEARV